MESVHICVYANCVYPYFHTRSHTRTHSHTHRHIQVHSMTVSVLTSPGSSASSFTCARLSYVTGLLAGNGKTACWPVSLPARHSFPPSLPPAYPPMCALGPVCLPLLWGLYCLLLMLHLGLKPWLLSWAVALFSPVYRLCLSAAQLIVILSFPCLEGSLDFSSECAPHPIWPISLTDTSMLPVSQTPRLGTFPDSSSLTADIPPTGKFHGFLHNVPQTILLLITPTSPTLI